MLYSERQPTQRSFVLAFLLTVIVYVLAILLLAVRNDEALNAAMATDMVTHGDIAKTHVYGLPVREFPLYSWLVALCSSLQFPTIITLRLPSVLSMIGIAVLAGLTAKRLQNVLAGYIATAVVLFCVVSFQNGVRANAEMLQAFLLCGAWCSCLVYGVGDHAWKKAWIIASFFVLLGIFNTGIRSVFWFYFPLVLMPAHLYTRKRMQMSVHVLFCLPIIAVIIGLWLMLAADQPLFPWEVENGLPVFTGTSKSGYIAHLFLFPLKTIWYLFPWSLLMWAPFCIALRPFEQSPTACWFLRCIVTFIFVLNWIYPNTSPLYMLPLLGPMAILIGIHFEIVLRRHERYFRAILRFAAWVISLAALLAAGFWTLVATGFIVRQFDHNSMQATYLAGTLTILALVLWSIVARRDASISCRSAIIWCAATAFLTYLLSFGFIRQQWNYSDKLLSALILTGRHTPIETQGALTPEQQATAPQWNGDTLQQHASSDISCIYYRPPQETYNLYLTDFFHLGYPVQVLPFSPNWNTIFMDKTTQRPMPVVYVLSARIPPSITHKWEPISPLVDMSIRRKLRVVRRSQCPKELLPELPPGARQPKLIITQSPRKPIYATPDQTCLQLFVGIPLPNEKQTKQETIN